ncbi:MAG: CRTAC1 family protein [Candidatus Acidiferrum sp.]
MQQLEPCVQRSNNNFLRTVVASAVVCLLLGFAPMVPEAQDAPKAYQSAGTQKMAALLRKIYAEQDWKTDPNKDGVRAQYYRQMLQGKPDLPHELKIRQALAECELRAGDSAGAIEQLETVRRLEKENGVSLQPEFDKDLRDSLGLAYLRLGEQQNCIANHGPDSCLLPLKGGGVHTQLRGAKGAVREFSAALEANPKDLKSQWLLNIAYMQLGQYPSEVPKQWLVPPSVFSTEFDVGRFVDVASQVGLTNTGHSGGVVMEDFDGDGLLDIVITTSGPLDQMRLFHNNGDGTFTDRTREAGLIGEVGGLNAISTDYNNDGRPDLLVLRGGWWAEHGKYPMSLLRNNGDGTFDDVTEEAGLMSLHPTQTAAWADYDNDGWLDLFVGHETTGKESHPCQLFHNNRDGTFTDVARAVGLADLGFVKGVAWGDFNNDGRPDLYISRKSQTNLLFRNDGPRDAKLPAAAQWKFTDVTELAGVAKQTNSFPTWFFDYDNDGWPDIFVAGYWMDTYDDVAAFEMRKPYKAETPKLYHNNHDGTFTDVTKQMKLDRAILVMGANFGDLDNDGWLDIYLGTGDPAYEALLANRLFRNNEGKVFQDVTGSADVGDLQKGHGVAFGDLRNNGQEDIFEVLGGAYPGDTYQSALFSNPGHRNHWITLQLEGVKSNRAAYGTRIDVKVKTAGGSTRHIYRTVGFGSSFGQNPMRQHIGLGDAQQILEIAIAWPAARGAQRFAELKLDSAYQVREGEAQMRILQLKQFAFAAGDDRHEHAAMN